MSGSGSVVAVREAVLDAVLGRTENEVLNPRPAEESFTTARDLAASLARAINVVKAEAIDACGRRVDYARLEAGPGFAAYRRLTPALRDLTLAHILTRRERLAFWLNLYNALVIDGVLTHEVRRSVMEGRLGMFTFFRRAAYRIGGARFSCDDIEHGVLRANRGHPFLPGPQFATSDPRLAWIIDPLDARVHFALNCASRSCPPIGVYDPDHVDAQLTLATRNFLDQETDLNRQRGELRLPRLFKWFARDFGGRPGAIAFLLHYLPNDDRRAWLEARGPRARFAYHRYDWSLNVLAG